MERMGNNMAEKGISQKSLKTLWSAAKKGIGQAKVNTHALFWPYIYKNHQNLFVYCNSLYAMFKLYDGFTFHLNHFIMRH